MQLANQHLRLNSFHKLKENLNRPNKLSTETVDKSVSKLSKTGVKRLELSVSIESPFNAHK